METLESSLKWFQTIDIESIWKSHLLHRHELKFRFDLTHAISVLNRLHKEGFRLITVQERFSLKYSNYYFDTKEYRLFKKGGASDGLKIRVREYESWDKYLEIKRKINWISKKTKEFIDPIPERLSMFGLDLVRVLENTYSRISFLSQDGRVRVTLDFNLQYTFPESSIRFLEENEYILELKWERVDVLQRRGRLGLYGVSDFSKFRNWIRKKKLISLRQNVYQ